MQGNLLAALLATFFGNPLTFPIIATCRSSLGHGCWACRMALPLPQIVAAFSNASLELWNNFTAIFTPEVTHWNRLADFF